METNEVRKFEVYHIDEYKDFPKWKRMVYETYDKISDKLFDITPSWLYRFYYEWIKFSVIEGKLKRFYQRLTRGWDDSETWSLDWAFYNWILPRLKRFQQVNFGYPYGKTVEEWDNEIKRMIGLLEIILEDEYDEHMEAREEFNEWFGKNVNSLWW